jgi:hypothetical protein
MQVKTSLFLFGSIDLPLGNYWIGVYYKINNTGRLYHRNLFIIEFTLAHELWTEIRMVINNLPTFFPIQ